MDSEVEATLALLFEGEAKVETEAAAGVNEAPEVDDGAEDRGKELSAPVVGLESVLTSKLEVEGLPSEGPTGLSD